MFYNHFQGALRRVEAELQEQVRTNLDAMIWSHYLPETTHRQPHNQVAADILADIRAVVDTLPTSYYVCTDAVGADKMMVYTQPDNPNMYIWFHPAMYGTLRTKLIVREHEQGHGLILGGSEVYKIDEAYSKYRALPPIVEGEEPID